MALTPFQQFLTDDIQFKFVEKTYHRPNIGGFEKWEFTVKDESYAFFADCRDLTVAPEQVLVISLFKHVVENGVDKWLPIWEPNVGSVNKLISCITQLAYQIQLSRRYRYLAIHSCPDWKKLLDFFMKRICVIASPEIHENVFNIFKYDLQRLVDAGYMDIIVGDLYTNPGFIELLSRYPGADIKL